MGGRNLGNVVEIMKNDFKSAFSNPIVTIILIGLIILPSLYALLNIQACWDPYGNTGDVQFAIANLDEGATFEGTKLNVGQQLVNELKGNDKFDWTFVSEEELHKGVYDGKYYAGIVIPKNLTKNILSILGDDPQQAKLEYYVNMKANPVGAKLTDTGSNTVYLSLNAKIVQFINLAAYGKLGELHDALSSGGTQLTSGGVQLEDGADKVSSGASQVSDGVDKVKDGSNQVKSGAKEVDKGSKKLKTSSKKVEQGSKKVGDSSKKVQEGSKKVEEGADKVQYGSEELQSTVDPSLLPDGPVKQYVESTDELAQGSGEVAKGANQLANGSVQLADGSVKLADGSVQLADGSVKLADGSSAVAKGASDLASGSTELAEGSLSLAAGSQLLSNAAAQALFSAGASLTSSADSLSGITGINETILGDYFYSPVKLDRHEIFPVPDYGSQVSPFYLVLSMWVGGLITCALLKPGISEGTKYSPLEMYFGKLALFLIMGLFQSCVTIIGSLLLGIYIDNLLLFIFSSILVSGVFMAIIYSLVSALGDVGKAIAVVVLVIQISGTNGIYPVQIMDSFFQVMYPYLPMTYAITLIREAQLGVIWSNYLPALLVLLGIGAATIVVLLIIKEKADKPAHYFEKCLDDSGLF